MPLQFRDLTRNRTVAARRAADFGVDTLASPSILRPASELDFRMGIDWRRDEAGTIF
jgi:hypothetical protein